MNDEDNKDIVFFLPELADSNCLAHPRPYSFFFRPIVDFFNSEMDAPQSVGLLVGSVLGCVRAVADCHRFNAFTIGILSPLAFI